MRRQTACKPISCSFPTFVLLLTSRRKGRVSTVSPRTAPAHSASATPGSQAPEGHAGGDAGGAGGTSHLQLQLDEPPSARLARPKAQQKTRSLAALAARGSSGDDAGGGGGGAAANGRPSDSQRGQQRPAADADTPLISLRTLVAGASGGGRAARSRHSAGRLDPSFTSACAAGADAGPRADADAPGSSRETGGSSRAQPILPAASARATSAAATASGSRCVSADGDAEASTGSRSQRQAQSAAQQQLAIATEPAAAAAAATQPPQQKSKPSSIFQLSLPSNPKPTAPAAAAQSASGKPSSKSDAALQEAGTSMPRPGGAGTPREGAPAIPKMAPSPPLQRQRKAFGRDTAAKPAVRPAKPLGDPAEAAMQQKEPPPWARKREKHQQQQQQQQQPQRTAPVAAAYAPARPVKSPRSPRPPQHDPWAFNPGEVKAAVAQQVSAPHAGAGPRPHPGGASATPLGPPAPSPLPPPVAGEAGAVDAAEARQARLPPLRMPLRGPATESRQGGSGAAAPGSAGESALPPQGLITPELAEELAKLQRGPPPLGRTPDPRVPAQQLLQYQPHQQQQYQPQQHHHQKQQPPPPQQEQQQQYQHQQQPPPLAQQGSFGHGAWRQQEPAAWHHQAPAHVQPQPQPKPQPDPTLAHWSAITRQPQSGAANMPPGLTPEAPAPAKLPPGPSPHLPGSAGVPAQQWQGGSCGGGTGAGPSSLVPPTVTPTMPKTPRVRLPEVKTYPLLLRRTLHPNQHHVFTRL